MCRTLVDGGRRCAATDTTNARRVLVQRMTRRAALGKDSLAEADARAIADLDAARARYGNVVTPMSLPVPTSVDAVFTVFRDAGFRSLVVGGSVRDALTDGRAPKDIDVEVYGATIDDTLTVLRDAGYRVDEVGRSFGVLKVALPDGTDLDVSVPRRDNHVGAGHRGFTVDTDTAMTVEEAAARRDFTINALGFDPEYGVCVDPYGGRADLHDKVLRATSEAFAEDPLRVLRGFQFAARYGMTLDEDTATTCRRLVDRAGELPVERVRGEWGKFYTKGSHPGHGLGVLTQTGWDVTVPGLTRVNTAETRSQVDRAAEVATADGLDAEGRARLLSATLARSMPDGEAKAFTKHTLEGGDLQRAAYRLSRARWAGEVKDAGVRGFAHTLGGDVTVREWARLETVTGDPGTADRVLAVAERLGCADGPQPDLVLGRDIIARFPTLRPGPWTGEVQRAARQAQIDGVFNTREQAEAWLTAHEVTGS